MHHFRPQWARSQRCFRASTSLGPLIGHSLVTLLQEFLRPKLDFLRPPFFYIPAFSSVWKSGKRTRPHFRPLGVVWPTIIIFRDKCTRFMRSNFGKLYSYSHPQLSYTSWGGEKNEKNMTNLSSNVPRNRLIWWETNCNNGSACSRTLSIVPSFLEIWCCIQIRNLDLV